MEYGKIIAISGMGGLYELVGSKKDGAIVRSLDDKSTKFVSSRIHNFSHLESIEVYTNRDNVNLVEVLVAMENAAETLPSDKDASAIKTYFEKVYPEMDFERVYTSDMKKMVKWYSVLKANGVEFKLSLQEEQADQSTEDEQALEDNQPEQTEDTNRPETTPSVKSSDASKVTETVIPEAEKQEAEQGPAPELSETVADGDGTTGSAPKKKAPKKKKAEE